MDKNNNLKNHYVKDLKYRDKVIHMNRDINPHISEIFTDDMLIHLHHLKISYKYFSSFVIGPYTSELNIKHYLETVQDEFKYRDWVISLGHHNLCKLNNIDNLQHPKFNYKTKYKIFSNDQLKERQQIQKHNFDISQKGNCYYNSEHYKELKKKQNKRYYQKHKDKILSKYYNYQDVLLFLDSFNLEEQLKKQPTKSILKNKKDIINNPNKNNFS